MDALAIIIVGAYLVAVGMKKQGGEFWTYVQQDAPGYVPWLAVVFGLSVAYQTPAFRQVVRAFVVLIVLGLLVKDKSNVISETSKIYNHYVKGQPL